MLTFVIIVDYILGEEVPGFIRKSCPASHLIFGIVTVNSDAVAMIIIGHCHHHHHDQSRDEEGPGCVTALLATSQCQLHLLQLILILASILTKMILL